MNGNVKSRRLVIATSVYPPEIGGPGVYFARLKEELEKKGWDVEVMVRPGFASICKIPSDAVVLAHATPKFLLPVFIAKFFKRFRVVVRIGGDFFWERAIEEGSYDRTLLEFYKNFQFLPQEYSKQAISNFQTFALLRVYTVFLLMKFLLQRADTVIFTTNFLKDIYVPVFGLDTKKVFTVTHAVSQYKVSGFRFQASEKADARIRLLYAGRFLKLKNLAMLLEVFTEAREKHPNLFLTLVGEGPQEHQLRNVAQTYDLANAVEFKKPVSHAILMEEVAKSDLVVLPSLSDVSPNVLMDALACGTPMLATKESGLWDVIGDAAVWFDPMSKEDFAAKLEGVLEPGMLRAMWEKMQAHPYKKTWEEVAKEYETIFENSKFQAPNSK